MNYLEKRKQTLFSYLPELTKQKNFDVFWSDKIRRSEQITIKSKFLKRKEWSPYAEVYDVFYNGTDGTEIHGIYMCPLFVKKENYPCLIQYHGFSLGCALPSQLAHWVLQGLCVFAPDCREQGGQTGNKASYSGIGMVGNVTTKGILKKEEYYYGDVYMDAVRAIGVLLGRREIDKKRIIVRGTSQGGALAIAVSALSDIPALCIANVPSNSNLERRVEGAHGSFAAVTELLRRAPQYTEKVYETLSYFDTMNLADRICCPVYASVALADEICPAECFFATYNRIEAKKEITVYPFNGHDGAGDVHLEKELSYLWKSGILSD